jgi:NADPH:quinone reductase-like Zn-dependent oxidoreductase
MKAVVYHRYGSPDVIEIGEIEKPTAADDQVLVHVHAASVNPLDWHAMRGLPYIARMEFGLRKPASAVLGVDFAGTVESVGKGVTQFQSGDEVFGGRGRALAEYMCVPEDRAIAVKPANLTFEQAAAVPAAGFTALQGIRDKGQVHAGQRVLINGAAGGVGTFAVQIAKAFSAEVTGVCSTRNVEMVRSIGADHVIDYTREDFTRPEQRYDVLLDAVGNRPASEVRRALTHNGTLVLVGGKGGRLLGPLTSFLTAAAMSRFVSQNLIPFLAKNNKADLLVLKELIEAGKITPVIDRSYPLRQAAEALRYLEQGHANGKVVITV